MSSGKQDYQQRPLIHAEHQLLRTGVDEVSVPIAKNTGWRLRLGVARSSQPLEKLLCAPERNHCGQF